MPESPERLSGSQTSRETGSAKDFLEEGGSLLPPPLRQTIRIWPASTAVVFGIIAANVLLLWALGLLPWQAHGPKEIGDDMLPALVDLMASERAEKCNSLVETLAEFRAGKPYEVEELGWGTNCKLVAKGSPDKKFTVGGFQLPTMENCRILRDDLQEKVEQHENNQAVKVKLYCGEDGKPTTNPDDSVRLAAQIELRRRLPDVVKAVNEGRVSANISECYFGVKEQIVAMAEEARKLRCNVLDADMKVPRVTWDALWERSALKEELEDFRKENADLWEKLAKEDNVTVLFAQFTDEAKERACADSAEPTLTTIRTAAQTAARTCF